jgi:capsular exopolysaccharide synthesis family protein
VETISDYSAHADQKDLLNFVRRMRKKPHTVHSDDDAKQTFKGQLLKERLAAVVAQSGQKALLIDMDLRRGYMHKMFDMGPEDGVSDVLSKRISLQNAIKSTKVGELSILPRGTIPPNPSELLMSQGLTDLLNEVKDQYDLVIVDTPPVMAVTATTPLSAATAALPCWSPALASTPPRRLN